MVNRVWEWHFGRGLVNSSNDFGSRGEAPSHPELLDRLAAEFVRSGSSVKHLHRLILSTAAWQRNCASASNSDPDNRWLAHFNRRRLTAEELRDSLLSVSGQLELSPAEGHPFPPEASWTFTQHTPFNAIYDTNRRSAYLMVQRQRRHPFLSLFDGADPNASTAARQTTTVPTQALYFINDPFFHGQADALGGKVTALSDDDLRLTEMCQTVFQREPKPDERKRLLSFVDNYPGTSTDKWSALARVLLASNEFLYVE